MGHLLRLKRKGCVRSWTQLLASKETITLLASKAGSNGNPLGTEIFQDENNGLDSVSAAGAKLRDAKDKALQGQ